MRQGLLELAQMYFMPLRCCRGLLTGKRAFEQHNLIGTPARSLAQAIDLHRHPGRQFVVVGQQCRISRGRRFLDLTQGGFRVVSTLREERA